MDSPLPVLASLHCGPIGQRESPEFWCLIIHTMLQPPRLVLEFLLPWRLLLDSQVWSRWRMSFQQQQWDLRQKLHRQRVRDCRICVEWERGWHTFDPKETTHLYVVTSRRIMLLIFVFPPLFRKTFKNSLHTACSFHQGRAMLISVCYAALALGGFYAAPWLKQGPNQSRTVFGLAVWEKSVKCEWCNKTLNYHFFHYFSMISAGILFFKWFGPFIAIFETKDLGLYFFLPDLKSGDWRSQDTKDGLGTQATLTPVVPRGLCLWSAIPAAIAGSWGEWNSIFRRFWCLDSIWRGHEIGRRRVDLDVRQSYDSKIECLRCLGTGISNRSLWTGGSAEDLRAIRDLLHSTVDTEVTKIDCSKNSISSHFLLSSCEGIILSHIILNTPRCFRRIHLYFTSSRLVGIFTLGTCSPLKKAILKRTFSSIFLPSGWYRKCQESESLRLTDSSDVCRLCRLAVRLTNNAQVLSKMAERNDRSAEYSAVYGEVSSNSDTINVCNISMVSLRMILGNWMPDAIRFRHRFDYGSCDAKQHRSSGHQHHHHQLISKAAMKRTLGSANIERWLLLQVE